MDPKRLDSFYRKAKTEGFAARSVYKLEEIDQKNRLIRQNHRILDLGASPGSWMQYISDKVGESGFVLGVDVSALMVGLAPQAQFLQKNVFELSGEDLKSQYGCFDGVISDMAPKTTGVEDQLKSFELCEKALSLSINILNKNGFFVFKMFQSEHTKPLVEQLKNLFKEVKIFKPKASRKQSKEIFIVCQKFLKEAK